MELSLLEKLIEEDFGYESNGENWGRSKEHDSLVVDKRKGIFFWNSEGISGDAYIYLIKVRKLPELDAKEYLKVGRFTGTFISELKDGTETIVYPKLVKVFHQELLRGDRSYFYKRTITDETISRFELGLHGDFYTIPIYQDGIFRQFQLRKDNPKTIRNYYKGVGGLLFNSVVMNFSNKINFVEGVTSCLVLNQNGMSSVSSNTGAEGFMESWYSYFVHQREITLLYDHDSAGEYGAKRTAKILGEDRCKIYCFWDFEEKGYDANDWFIDGGTADGLKEIINNNSKYLYELESKFFKGMKK